MTREQRKLALALRRAMHACGSHYREAHQGVEAAVREVAEVCGADPREFWIAATQDTTDKEE